MTNHVSLHEITELSPDEGERAWWTRRVLGVLAAWALLVAVTSALGLFRAFPLPYIAPIVAAGIGGPIALYALHGRFRAYMRGLRLETLTVFHLWRIVAALVFFAYGAAGALPETFVRHAAWGDLLAGLLVIPVLLVRGQTFAKYLSFHVIGFADFVLAVGTGLYFSLIDDPAMATIATFPLALIPLFGVAVSGASHLIAFDLLRVRRRRPKNRGGCA